MSNYITRRDEAMLDYPDTTKLEELVRDYPVFFSPQFIVLWATATPDTKVRTLEYMIKEWTRAPEWLLKKVNEAEAERGRKV